MRMRKKNQLMYFYSLMIAAIGFQQIWFSFMILDGQCRNVSTFLGVNSMVFVALGIIGMIIAVKRDQAQDKSNKIDDVKIDFRNENAQCLQCGYEPDCKEYFKNCAYDGRKLDEDQAQDIAEAQDG